MYARYLSVHQMHHLDMFLSDKDSLTLGQQHFLDDSQYVTENHVITSIAKEVMNIRGNK